MQPGSFPKQLQRAAASLTATLIALVVAWLLLDQFSASRALFAALAITPLWLGLRRLPRTDRRTYAWMTLATIPCLTFALTEAVANPAARTWAGLCLFIAFALFVTLIGCVRATQPTGGDMDS